MPQKSSRRRSSKRVCYGKQLREDGETSSPKRHETVTYERRGCYGKPLRDLPKSVHRRGRTLYYRKTLPADEQRLLNRLEIWRSLRTDSLTVAQRRLPILDASIGAVIEEARAANAVHFYRLRHAKPSCAHAGSPRMSGIDYPRPQVPPESLSCVMRVGRIGIRSIGFKHAVADSSPSVSRRS